MKHYRSTKTAKKEYLLTASTDGINIDYEEIIESENEPDFWTCYEKATAHGCDFFHVQELETIAG